MVYKRIFLQHIAGNNINTRLLPPPSHPPDLPLPEVAGLIRIFGSCNEDKTLKLMINIIVCSVVIFIIIIIVIM